MLSVVFRPTARCSARLYQSVLAKSFSEAVAVQTESSSSIEGNKPTRHTLEEAVISALTVHKAVTKVKNVAWANFDETVDIAINTSLDPRKPNQSVKGIASLPYGTGKAVRVCVFAVGAAASEAKEAGAEVVGSENLVAQIQAGNLNFDTVIATPDMMAVVGKLGRILGPRGMMPNPKTGTVTNEAGKAVRAAKAGAVKFKVGKTGIIHARVGKRSFSDEALLGNIRALMLAVAEVKPEGFKGKYFKSVAISSTMGPGIPIELPTVDPGNARFMLDMSINEEA